MDVSSYNPYTQSINIYNSGANQEAIKIKVDGVEKELWTSKISEETDTDTGSYTLSSGDGLMSSEFTGNPTYVVFGYLESDNTFQEIFPLNLGVPQVKTTDVELPALQGSLVGGSPGPQILIPEFTAKPEDYGLSSTASASDNLDGPSNGYSTPKIPDFPTALYSNPPEKMIYVKDVKDATESVVAKAYAVLDESNELTPVSYASMTAGGPPPLWDKYWPMHTNPDGTLTYNGISLQPDSSFFDMSIAPPAASAHDMSGNAPLTSSDYSFSNDIYLNATEEAIKELLASGTVSDKAFNFDFYTKMDVKTDDGMVTVNLKLQTDDNQSFKLNANDIDVAVESFYNVAEDAGAAVTSSGEAGDFVKIDNAGDIALGNGGDDTYVVGADSDGDIFGGVALEYGNIGQFGGLTGSVDAVNFNSVTSVDQLTFTRGQHRNEADGNTLFISDGGGNNTTLFDNYNEYLDFRRVEYLTVEDGSNNNEIYEIVTDASDSFKNLDWDNEIYVTNGGTTQVELGGIDYVIGDIGQKDDFEIDLSDLITIDSSTKTGTINLSGIDASDTITVNDGGKLSESDEIALESALKASVEGVAQLDGKATVEFIYDTSGLTLSVDAYGDALDLTDRNFDWL